MSTTATTGFVSAYLDTTECEIGWMDSELTAYIPRKEEFAAYLKLGTRDYVEAELNARAAGLEPKWGMS